MKGKLTACKKILGDKGHVLFLFLLFLYPFLHVNRGIDLMDAGYGLANYRFIENMDINWKLATFFSNLLGALLMKLPGGATYLGMNCYTALLLAVIAAATYWILVSQFGHPVLLFLGEWMALSLCWAPKTILYHYLGYFMMTLAILCLEKAIMRDQELYYIIAGILLGAAVLVRFPNITYMACILIVWADCFFQKKRWQTLFWRTGICVVGYVIGLAVPFAYICYRYGFSSYTGMIQWLFGMTETATDYKPTSMVTAMFGDYISYAIWLVFLLLYLAVGLIAFRIVKGRWQKALKVIYLLGVPVLLRFFYGRGMFGLNYRSYFSMYKWLVVFLLAFWILAIWVLVRGDRICNHFNMEKQKEYQLKRFTIGMMVVVLITPLGSNNGLYPIINNLFLVAPFTCYLLWILTKYYQRFAVRTVVATLGVCTLVQSCAFGFCFTFHDGTDGESLTAQVDSIPVLKGMYTTAKRAENLEGLYEYLEEQHLIEQQVVLYGDIPGISYVMQMPSAIFTTWGDLASNTTLQFQDAMSGLQMDIQQGILEKSPVVIVSAEAGAYLTEDGESVRILETEGMMEKADDKMQIISTFLSENHYQNTYCNQEYMVFEVQ